MDETSQERSRSVETSDAEHRPQAGIRRSVRIQSAMSREDIASLVRTDSEPLTSRIEPLKDENKVLKDENKGLKDENKGLKRKVRGLEDQITIFKEECGEREARFQEVQHEALTRSKNDGFDALPDDVVKDELKNIFARGRHWAKNYAIPVSSMSEDVKKGIRVMLRGPENKESASLDGYQAACDGRINTRHVLTAMVARELAYHLFHRPFFYFQNNKQRSRQSTEKQLLSVQKMGTDSTLSSCLLDTANDRSRRRKDAASMASHDGTHAWRSEAQCHGTGR